MRLVSQYFSSFILNFKENEKYNWDSLQILTGIDSMEDWEHIRISFCSFTAHQRKNLLQVVTKDLVTINDGKWRGDVLRNLLQLPYDEWDDALDCELSKKDFIYGFLKNQITIIIPFSIAGIILYPGSHHLLSHLILSGFSIIKQNNLIDDFYRFERFLKNLSTWKFSTHSITWGK
jgi:acyl carrier protein